MSTHSSANSYPSSPPQNSGNATGPAAANAAQLAIIALAQSHNEKAPRYYFVAMGGLIALFTAFHWAELLYSRRASKVSRGSSIMKGPVTTARSFRNVLVRQVPGFPSVGHLVLVLIYLAINVILTATFIDWSTSTSIGNRCGWMAITNVAFITFLALKNTPLAFLTSYSHERLNGLHQIGGYTTVTYVFLHLILNCTGFMKEHLPAILLMEEQKFGMVAGSAMLVTLIAAAVIRRVRYELFYVIHIIMYMIIIITVGLHRPDSSEKVVYITIVAGSIWILDRILRGTRLLSYSLGNRATITPLPNGGTRIVLKRGPSRATPGSHAFLWIPRVRIFESHPFTIVSAGPNSLEFVVAAYDGFTHDLHRHAVKHPGDSLRASFDGPYGALPNFPKVADKVIFVAGGSGASFTFGVALDMIKRLGTSTKTKIDFIWTVKEHEALSWFTKELIELQSSPLVTTYLHTTRSASPSMTNIESQDTSSPSSHTILEDEKQIQVASASPKTEYDIEKHLSPSTSSMAPAGSTNPWDSTSSLSIIPGRPDVERLIREVVRKATDSDRVAIVACGPDGLMRTVRNTAAACIKVKGPSVELHCEQFGF